MVLDKVKLVRVKPETEFHRMVSMESRSELKKTFFRRNV